MSSRSSHRDRVKKQALFRDDGGGGYTVTPTCVTASIDVRKDTEREHLFTNTSTVPCTVKHDLEECLQPIHCFLFVPIVLGVCFPIGNKECVRPSWSFAPPDSFASKNIIDWDPSSIVAYQALFLSNLSDLMPKDAIQGWANFFFVVW